MREIKFRAWGTNINEYMGIPNKPSDVVNILGELINRGTWTIEQYTGLKDKNGKEIYEGDIVKLWDREPEMVVWDNLIGAYDPLSWETFDTDECEVVGNIHENPELIGGKE